MPTITTQAIVLRHADYREHDRMLTLLSPDMGRVEAMSRGCKKMNSPLLAASEWFAFGEYTLYANKERMTVTSCHLIESFYPLRTDWERLKHASYILSVCEAAIQPGEPAFHLFTLLVRSLSRLAYSDIAMNSVTAAFLLHFVSISGYQPQLDCCTQCGKPLSDDEIHWFSAAEGGLICTNCLSQMLNCIPVTSEEVRWMRDVLKIGIEKTNLPESWAPCRLLSRYAEMRLDHKICSAPW